MFGDEFSIFESARQNEIFIISSSIDSCYQLTRMDGANEVGCNSSINARAGRKQINAVVIEIEIP